ncbi:phage integrase central domain-containing protein [Campylobacter ureolyticus]|uniref:phage integrase central domain-containing protein n=1 Tax=Campylobacter ureolyticus TaxID=827 RepID=UPI002F9637ED
MKDNKRIKHSSVLKSNKYTIGALFDSYIKLKQATLTPNYTKKIISQMQTYILPKFENTDIANIKFSHLKEVLDPLLILIIHTRLVLKQ